MGAESESGDRQVRADIYDAIFTHGAVHTVAAVEDLLAAHGITCRMTCCQTSDDA